jgi:hypothetical protein
VVNEYKEHTMPYVENRVVHDADSHLMELPDALDEFLEARFRARYDSLPKLAKFPRDAEYVNRARAIRSSGSTNLSRTPMTAPCSDSTATISSISWAKDCRRICASRKS